MITLNGKNIPVGNDFNVRMSWVNPACFFDKIPGNAGLGITIPVNEYSRAYLGNPGRFEKYSSASDRKFPGFEIRKNGILYESGTLVITTADSENYNGWLQSDVGVLGEEQQSKFIAALDWEINNVFVNNTPSDPEIHHYCRANIRNEEFWQGKGAHGKVMVPYINENGQLDVREEYQNYLNQMFRENADYQINYDAEPGQVYIVSPFLFFRYFVKELLKLNRFYIRSHPFDNIPGANALALYNNFSIIGPAPVTVLRTFETFDTKLNRWQTVTHEVIDNHNWDIQPFNYADLVPKISVKDALLSIQNFLNVCFVFNPDRTVNIIDREAILSGAAAFDLTPYQVSPWRKTGERKHTSLKFISEYDKSDANFGDEFHDLSDRRKDFKEAVDDLTDLANITNPAFPGFDRTLGQLRYVRSENKVYEYKWTVFNKVNINRTEEQFDVLAWELVSSGPQHFIYGTGSEIEEIKTNISTLQMVAGELTARQPGNLSAIRSIWTDFTFRMFYYMGNTTGNVNNAAAGASCNWEGDTGIFNQRWKKWARFWSTREPFEADFDLPENVLQFVKNNITEKYRTEKGEFIIEEITADVGVMSNGIVTLKVFKK